MSGQPDDTASGSESGPVWAGPAKPGEIPRLIAIHRDGIPYSFNSRLGQEHMALVYDVVMSDPSSIVLAARIRDAPVGVCIATLDADALSRMLMRRFSFAHWKMIACAALRSPRLVANWLENAWVGRPVYHRGNAVRACLFAIAVDRTVRSRGIGASLVHGVDEFCRNAGCLAYRLDTRADNQGAQRFYQREGFAHVGQRGRNTIWIRELVQ